MSHRNGGQILHNSSFVFVQLEPIYIVLQCFYDAAMQSSANFKIDQ